MRLRKLLFWIPSIIWAIIIFSISNKSGNELPSLKFGLDKLAHIVVYSFLSYLLLFAYVNTSNQKYLRKIYLAFLIAFLYGIFEEFHQLFVPGRFFSFADMYANLVGSIIGILIWHFDILNHKKKILKWARMIK